MSDGSVARAGAREAVRVAGQVRTQSANLDICDENKHIERERCTNLLLAKEPVTLGSENSALSHLRQERQIKNELLHISNAT